MHALRRHPCPQNHALERGGKVRPAASVSVNPFRTAPAFMPLHAARDERHVLLGSGEVHPFEVRVRIAVAASEEARRELCAGGPGAEERRNVRRVHAPGGDHRERRAGADVRQEGGEALVDVADGPASLGALGHQELGAPFHVHRGEAA